MDLYKSHKPVRPAVYAGDYNHVCHRTSTPDCESAEAGLRRPPSIGEEDKAVSFRITDSPCGELPGSDERDSNVLPAALTPAMRGSPVVIQIGGEISDVSRCIS